MDATVAVPDNIFADCSGGVLQEAPQSVLHPLHPQVGFREDTEERAAGQARRRCDSLSKQFKTQEAPSLGLLRAIHLVVPWHHGT